MNYFDEPQENLRTRTNRMTEDEDMWMRSGLFAIRISYGCFLLCLNGECGVECSYVYGYNSARHLLNAFADLLENKCKKRWILFPDEPVAELLKLERAEDTLNMEVYNTHRDKQSHNFAFGDPKDWERHIADCIFKSSSDIMWAAKRLRNEFGLYVNGDGRQLYDQHWMGFPQKEYDRLLCVIRSMKS